MAENIVDSNLSTPVANTGSCLETSDHSDSGSDSDTLLKKTYPQKKYYRQRAHCNPLSFHDLNPPISPQQMDWSPHYPRYFTPNIQSSNSTTINIDHIGTPGSNSVVLPVVEFLDVGCGYGGLLIELSTLFPDTLSLGIEIRIKVMDFVKDRIHSLRKKFPEQYQNISVLRTNAMKCLPNYFLKGQLTKLFFLYPDPHFKKSKHKWRIISPTLLAEYAYFLKPGGILYVATDVLEVHEWMHKHISNHPLFSELSKEEKSEDKCVSLLNSVSEEAQKVTRNKQIHYNVCFKRIPDPYFIKD